MGDIGSWLEQHGLGKYIEVFLENEIDLQVLPELEEDDLEKLGLPMGPRKKILRAVRALDEVRSGSSSTGKYVPPPRPQGEHAERRQLTVMFCDLVGSTQLSGELELEAYRNLLSAYQDAARAAINPYEGFIARYMGDGLLVYFGYPQAHEDDAERAVRAALAVTSAVPELDVGLDETLSVRIGIATGQVVAGDIVGEGASEERAVLGETPNLAARLQSIAHPNSVVISETTKHLIAGTFDLQPLGAHELKGINGPMLAYRAVALRVQASRFEATHALGQLTPLSGRDSELSLLMHRWGQARVDEGQVVFIEGEPGIGKSRLIQALREQISGSASVVQRFQCSPYYTNSAFYPIIDLIERTAGLSREDELNEKLDKLSSTVADLLPGDERATALVAALLSLPIERFAALEMTPQKQRSETIRVLLAQVEALASTGPILMVFEDAHWCDPSTLELMGSIIERVQSLPVLMVVTHRPEFTPSWNDYGHLTSYSLNRLGRDAAGALVEGVTAGKSLPEEITAEIIEKADGVPLFVEELTKTLLDSTFLVDAGDHWELDGPLVSLAIPSTLQDLLVSRLDRLSSIKETVQLGACIGRAFSYELLAAVSSTRGAELTQALEQLVKEGLVFRRGEIPGATFTFKHALVQEAARNTLLPSRLQQFHAEIVAAMQRLYPEVEQLRPELLAHHFSEARDLRRAAELWKRAGEIAARRSANSEAIAHCHHGLDCLAAIEEPDAPLELQLQLILGPCSLATRGYNAPQVERAYQRARELCTQLHDTDRLAVVVRGLVLYNLMFDLDAAKEIGESLLDAVSGSQTVAPGMVSHYVLGIVCLWRGELAEGQHHLETALSLFRPEEHDGLEAEYGIDIKAGATVFAGFAHALNGKNARATTVLADAAARAESINHAFTTIGINVVGAIAAQVQGDIEAAARLTKTGLDAAHQQGNRLYGSWAETVQGWLDVTHGGPKGYDVLRASRRTSFDMGVLWHGTHAAVLGADSLIKLRRFDEAFREVDKGISVAARVHSKLFDSEFHRLRGLAYAGRGDLNEAESALRLAVELSRELQLPIFELRAVNSLAQHYLSLNRASEARQICDAAARLLGSTDGPATELLRSLTIATQQN